MTWEVFSDDLSCTSNSLTVMTVLCAFIGFRIQLPKRLPIITALPRIRPFLGNCIMEVEVGKCSIGVCFLHPYPTGMLSDSPTARLRHSPAIKRRFLGSR